MSLARDCSTRCLGLVEKQMSIVERALEKAQRSLVASEPTQAAGILPAAIPPSAPDEARKSATAPKDAELGTLRPRKKLVMNLEALRAAGALPPVDSERRMAAEYGRIKRPLVERASNIATDDAGMSRALLITSAVPGEGKTFTAFNLALSLSRERDYHALLIDTDVARPHLSHLLNVRNEQGFLDSLRNPAIDIEQLILETDFPGLTVLPVGGQSDQDSELLASRRMAELMGRLVAADERRLIVLDSPPLLYTNEARELTNAVGQIVLVVRAGVTPQQVVFEAISLLGEGRVASLLLNQVPPSSARGRYYGYGQYGDYGRAGADQDSA